MIACYLLGLGLYNYHMLMIQYVAWPLVSKQNGVLNKWPHLYFGFYGVIWLSFVKHTILREVRLQIGSLAYGNGTIPTRMVIQTHNLRPLKQNKKILKQRISVTARVIIRLIIVSAANLANGRAKTLFSRINA